MFERKLIPKKEKKLDQENSQLIIQSLSFSQGLQSDVNTLQTDVNTLQSEMDQAQTDINSLESDVNTLESEMDQAQTDINALQPLQSDVNQLQTDVNTLESEMDQAQTDINIIEADYLKASNISNVDYNQSTWNGVTTIAPSKNVIRDKFESLSAGATLTLPTWPSSMVAMTLDNTWQDIDISGTYGAKTHLVLLHLYVNCVNNTSTIFFNDNSSDMTVFYRHQVANVQGRPFLQIKTDSNGVWSYKGTAISAAAYCILGVLTP